ALDLLAHAFDLLTRASRRFAHFALYPACNVLRHSFNLIAVHENPPKRARIARSGYQTSARDQKKRVQTRFRCKGNTEIASVRVAVPSRADEYSWPCEVHLAKGRFRPRRKIKAKRS